MAFRKIVETAIDRTKFAGLSLPMILKRPKYLILFILSFLLILYIFCFFGSGGSNWGLLWSGIPFASKIELLGRVATSMLECFRSLYSISLVLLSLLQALIIVQLVFSWRNREKDAAIDGASTGSIGAVLSFVALGCPSCGVGLLAPILSGIAGASAAALAETIGIFLTVIAFILLIFTVIRLGYIDYVLIINQKAPKEEHAKSH